MLNSGRFIPLCAYDDNDKLAGHLYIRYPDDTDGSARYCYEAAGFRPVGNEIYKMAAGNENVLKWS